LLRLRIAAALVLVLLFTGCIVAAVRVGQCSFDPPPGDQLSRVIKNDTSDAVSLVYCDDERCRRGFDETLVPPHKTTETIVEGCSTLTLAVVNPQTKTVMGCLTEQGDELGLPASASQRQVTVRRACLGSGGRPFKIHIHAPN
jgi:hypothetical protein